MSIFEAISLMIAFSILLVSLLSLIIKIIKLNERKK
ncbi:putative holin-like toxin [Ruminiclostridium sufflavum]|nr:putative holin-like toxin [Ruminiclostridium sufflavum]